MWESIVEDILSRQSKKSFDYEMYSIFFTDHSRKELKKLPLEVQKRVIRKLEYFSSLPLINHSIGGYRFRIGEYFWYTTVDG